MEKWAGQSHFKCSSVRGNYKEVLKTLKRYCVSSTAIMLLIKLNMCSIVGWIIATMSKYCCITNAYSALSAMRAHWCMSV